MPFVKINIDHEIEKRRKNDESFKKAWDDSREECKLIGETIVIRKQRKVAQTKFAELAGNKEE